MEPRPIQMRKADDTRLFVSWDDGRRGFVQWTALRAACPCATCNEERSQPPNPFRVVRPEEVTAGPPRPVSMTAVGHYAYKIIWNDGHDSGIYPLALLYQLTQEEAPSP